MYARHYHRLDSRLVPSSFCKPLILFEDFATSFKMTNKIYVGGLPWACSADDLRQVCAKFGVVEDGMYDRLFR